METVDSVHSDRILRLTALFHDIAKPRVRMKINGKYRFFKHAEESALMAVNIMKRLRFSNDVIKEVSNLITHHMIDYREDWSDGAIRRLIRRTGYGNIDKLISFRKADLSAHGITGQQNGPALQARKKNRGHKERYYG